MAEVKFKLEFIYPQIFHTGIIPEGYSDLQLLANGLSAWGCIFAGAEKPKFFGEMLVEIGNRLGCEPTAEGLMEYSNNRKTPPMRILQKSETQIKLEEVREKISKLDFDNNGNPVDREYAESLSAQELLLITKFYTDESN